MSQNYKFWRNVDDQCYQWKTPSFGITSIVTAMTQHKLLIFSMGKIRTKNLS